MDARDPPGAAAPLPKELAATRVPSRGVPAPMMSTVHGEKPQAPELPPPPLESRARASEVDVLPPARFGLAADGDILVNPSR